MTVSEKTGCILFCSADVSDGQKANEVLNRAEDVLRVRGAVEGSVQENFQGTVRYATERRASILNIVKGRDM